MPVTLITANTVVTAAGWWNPVSTLLNTVESGLATELTNRAAADTTLTNRLNSTIASGGISDLPTWKTSTDGVQTTQTNSINALNTAVGIPYGAGTSLAARATALETSQGTQDTSIGALNTAVGMPYGAGTSLASRVTVLEAGTAASPYVHVYQLSTGTQSIANNTKTALTFTAELRDTHNFHSNVTNTSRITPTVAGYYRCNGLASFIGASAGQLACQFRLNGAVVLGAAPYDNKQATNQGSLANTAPCDGTIYCNGSTDYIELWAFHVFGAATATFSNTTDQHSYMIVEYRGT